MAGTVADSAGSASAPDPACSHHRLRAGRRVQHSHDTRRYAIDVAVAGKSVKHVLFYSVAGAEYETIPFVRQFRFGEKYLEASGLQ